LSSRNVHTCRMSFCFTHPPENTGSTRPCCQSEMKLRNATIHANSSSIHSRFVSLMVTAQLYASHPGFPRCRRLIGRLWPLLWLNCPSRKKSNSDPTVVAFDILVVVQLRKSVYQGERRRSNCDHCSPMTNSFINPLVCNSSRSLKCGLRSLPPFPADP
jgi:hypothetical protein